MDESSKQYTAFTVGSLAFFECNCMPFGLSQRMGCDPINLNLKVIAECVLPQTYTEVCAFLGLVGHYQRFIKGFTCIAQPLSKYFTREWASRKSEQVLLTEDALKAFEALKQACMTAPILAFADYTKPLNHPRMDKGQYCHRRKQMGGTKPSPMAAGPLPLMRRNYHATKLKFLALKWAGTVHFKEYLHYWFFPGEDG